MLVYSSYDLAIYVLELDFKEMKMDVVVEKELSDREGISCLQDDGQFILYRRNLPGAELCNIHDVTTAGVRFQLPDWTQWDYFNDVTTIYDGNLYLPHFTFPQLDRIVLQKIGIMDLKTMDWTETPMDIYLSKENEVVGMFFYVHLSSVFRAYGHRSKLIILEIRIFIC